MPRPAGMFSTTWKNPLLSQFLDNRWIRLAVQDPANGRIHAYRDGEWEQIEGDEVPLPDVVTSADWYAGQREHLGVAAIVGNSPRATHRAVRV